LGKGWRLGPQHIEQAIVEFELFQTGKSNAQAERTAARPAIPRLVGIYQPVTEAQLMQKLPRQRRMQNGQDEVATALSTVAAGDQLLDIARQRWLNLRCRVGSGAHNGAFRVNARWI
jgi:hypothetical protein